MKSVLIVDDQETNITLLTKILGPEYTIYSAENGIDAIEAAEKHLPSVILLDILMFDMDGYAVISELKSSPKTKDIPVIFITSLDSDTDEEKGLSLGAADYITKPFSAAIVKLRIKNQIEMHDQLYTIEKLSKIDGLTELPNKRSFENRMNIEWARARREMMPISIMMIDVDFFKKYNDTYGHLQGDTALKAVADVFSETLRRPTDFAARWGGEEFAVILPNTNLDGALKIAEIIRKHTEDTEILCLDGSITKITVSIGINTKEVVTLLKNEDGTRLPHEQSNLIKDFISEADKALYDAKNRGRNRVCYFGE